MFNFYLKKRTIIAILLAIINNSSCSANTIHNGLIDNFNPIIDITTIFSLIHENSYWIIKPTSTPYLIGRNGVFSLLQSDIYNNHPFIIKLLREGNTPIGFIAYYMEKPQQGYLFALAIKEEFRKKGYGETLVRHSMNDLISMGAQSIVLWTRNNNLPALNLFKKLGFTTETINSNRLTDNDFTYLSYRPSDS